MIFTYSPRSASEVKNEVARMQAAAKKIGKTKASARAFLLKHGFITKSGKLAKAYRE